MADNAEQTTRGVDPRLAKHGKLSYIEIPAIDTLRSAEFYAKVFGWNVRGDAEHAGFDDPSGELIGHWVTGRAISREPGVLPYIYVQGIDKTLDDVTKEGGEVVLAPRPEGDLCVATFRDPAGNLMGMWQAGPR
jgi:predicted enzyme related to lactoylglutathione lyase